MPFESGQKHRSNSLFFFIIQETLTALQNPMAHISSVEPEFADPYQENLSNAKQVKAMNATNKVSIIQ